MYLDGSRMIHKRACAVGLDHQFYTFAGAPHVPYAGTSAAALAYMDTTVNFVRDFLVRQLGCTQAISQPENSPLQAATLYPINYCDGSPVDEACEIIGFDEIKSVDFSIYPNPAKDKLTVEFNAEGNYSIQIIDLMGRTIVANKSITSGTILSLDKLTSGNYFVVISDEKSNLKGTQQLVIK
jgi:hypothetical protein